MKRLRRDYIALGKQGKAVEAIAFGRLLRDEMATEYPVSTYAQVS